MPEICVTVCFGALPINAKAHSRLLAYIMASQITRIHMDCKSLGDFDCQLMEDPQVEHLRHHRPPRLPPTSITNINLIANGHFETSSMATIYNSVEYLLHMVKLMTSQGVEYTVSININNGPVGSCLLSFYCTFM
eukprot:4041591-Amphidinium_carterae.1